MLGKYWPEGVPFVETIDAFKQAYGTLGYEECASSRPEAGYQKIVIYADAMGVPTHAARQLEDGKWTSKLGKEWDISHHAPVGVTGIHYGDIAVFMRRLRLLA